MRLASLILMALFYTAAGINHFANTQFYLRMMPPYLPLHLELVYLSGAVEICLGIALLIRRCRQMAAWGIIALLVAIYPANIHMALNAHLFPEFSSLGLYLRLPVQLLFIAWAYWHTSIQVSEKETKMG